MEVNEESKSCLVVESLKGRHMSMLLSLKPNKDWAFLQLMLIRNWIATIEKSFSNLIPPRSPYCYVALENKKPIALLTLKPVNLRGTCWVLSLPNILEIPINYTEERIFRALLQYALESDNIRARSWLIESPITNNVELTVAREFGFRPLKISNCWSPPNYPQLISDKHKASHLNYQYEWQELNSDNTNCVLRLSQLWESSHLRQITSRNSNDILESRHTLSKVLISQSNNNAIAALIFKYSSKNCILVELVRDLAWDERLVSEISYILQILREKTVGKKLYIQTAQEDEKLTELMSQIGCNHIYETIILGRSLWRRQENKKLSIGAKKLESMLESLNPQTPPLPTPSVVQR